MSGAGGGYAQLCEEVAEGLYSRGHQIAVFTSRAAGTVFPRDYPVWRMFRSEPDWNSPLPAYLQFYLGREQRERQALLDLQKNIRAFAPDVVFVWHIAGIDRGIFRWLESSSDLPLVYYLADYAVETPDEYYAYWKEPARKNLKSIPKRIMAEKAIKTLATEGKPVCLEYENALCVSNFVRDRLVAKHIIPTSASVIHNGVNLKTLVPNGPERSFDTLDCVILGRLVPEKGIRTVVQSFSLLAKSNDLARLRLTLLGDGPSDYIASLKESIVRSGLQNVVLMRPSVNRNVIPNVLKEHNTLIFASEWDEPLARSVEEAMAMKLLVVGTNTGGPGELLIHHNTGLVFRAGDAADLAVQLRYALSDRSAIMKLAQAGCDWVHKSFDINSTIDKIEAYLHDLIPNRIHGISGERVDSGL